MQLVKEWLEQHNLMQYVSEITCEKPRAQYYIDDKAIRPDEFVKYNYDEILEIIK
jgi:hypothetical protein